jgi:hypothetical protein
MELTLETGKQGYMEKEPVILTGKRCIISASTAMTLMIRNSNL